MTNIGSLDSAETIAQFVSRVKETENITTWHVASAYALKLYSKGDLAVANIGNS